MSETKHTTLTPHLTCRNAAEAAAFYEKVFGAKVLCLYRIPDGRVMHGALSIDGATVYLVDEFPEHCTNGGQTLGASPVTLHLQVPDCDAVFNRAVAAGCEVRMPLDDMFWGDRYGLVADPYGHQWSIATTVRPVSPEELQQAIAGMQIGEA
jgi:uncharacterized glyoxalase superfamily protein PhnB